MPTGTEPDGLTNPRPRVTNGGSTIDPTANVLQLVDAAVKRINDLMDARTHLQAAELRRIDDLLEARNTLLAAREQRQDDLRAAESRHLKEIMELRATYDENLRAGETRRIDAIRAVDTGAVSRAAEVAAQQAATLAAQVQISADTLRGQVAASAQAAQVALATALEPLLKAVEDLRRVQYEQQGQKSAQSEGSGRSQWVIGVVVAVGLSLVSVAFEIIRLAIGK